MATITLKIDKDQAEYTTDDNKLEKVVDRFVRRTLRTQNVGMLPVSYETMTITQKLELTLETILGILSVDATQEQREVKYKEREVELEEELKEFDLRDKTTKGAKR